MIVVEDEILESRTTVADRLAETHGQSHPLGATLVPGGANFSIFSRSASIRLMTFSNGGPRRPLPDDRTRLARVRWSYSLLA
jgi:hypothetical protein